ncbi:diguanylate cyclase domain-containing protein [Telluria aromaticivorans]|uniref:diguanylate cyclase domain-containing protein n=1 Tax=Telluria aromaticivorans TaxID=2725995 RepID=UPI00353093A6
MATHDLAERAVGTADHPTNIHLSLPGVSQLAFNTIAQRIGGDEFVVLLPRCDGQEDAARVAENILVQLNEPFEDGELVHRISGSLGCAMFPGQGLDADALLRSADLAMYDAKSHGRNRVSSRYRGEAA